MSQLIRAGYSGPKEVQYLFVDGEQLRCAADSVGKLWFETPLELDYRSLQGSHQKVYFYDCLPAKKDNESVEQHGAKVAAKEAFFDSLRDIPGWHVNLGLAKHRKKSGMEQKEVDILIAVDMLTHTHRKNMHRLTFITGDQDFAPLVEAVVREGMYVELWYQDGHYSKDLRYFADAAQPMTLEFLHKYATSEFQKAYPMPQCHFDNDSHTRFDTILAEGYCDGMLVALFMRRTDAWLQIKSATMNSNGHYAAAVLNEEQMLKRYYAHWMKQDIEWRAVGSE